MVIDIQKECMYHKNTRSEYNIYNFLAEYTTVKGRRITIESTNQWQAGFAAALWGRTCGTTCSWKLNIRRF